MFGFGPLLILIAIAVIEDGTIVRDAGVDLAQTDLVGDLDDRLGDPVALAVQQEPGGLRSSLEDASLEAVGES